MLSANTIRRNALAIAVTLLVAACGAVVPPATQTASPLPTQQVVSIRLLAELFGQVVLVGDCLRVLDSNVPGESLLLVFAAGFTAQVTGDSVLLSDLHEHQQVTWHIGDTVEAFGGYLPRLDASLRPVPADCAGPYFVLNGWVAAATAYAASDLLGELKAAGLNVEVTKDQIDHGFSIRSTRWVLNGANLYVYEFDTPDDAATAAAGVSPDGYNISRSTNGQSVMRHGDWLATPHFYRRGRLIVIYAGDDPTLTSTLSQIVGVPFAGGVLYMQTPATPTPPPPAASR